MPDPLLPPPPGLTFYSPVKHGGVRNYVAITWTRRDLEACADLNLPCADASGLLLEPVGKGARWRRIQVGGRLGGAGRQQGII